MSRIRQSQVYLGADTIEARQPQRHLGTEKIKPSRVPNERAYQTENTFACVCCLPLKRTPRNIKKGQSQSSGLTNSTVPVLLEDSVLRAPWGLKWLRPTSPKDTWGGNGVPSAPGVREADITSTRMTDTLTTFANLLCGTARVLGGGRKKAEYCCQ